MPPTQASKENDKQEAAQQAVDILHEISTILVSPEAVHSPKSSRAGGGRNRLPQKDPLHRMSISLASTVMQASVAPQDLPAKNLYTNRERKKITRKQEEEADRFSTLATTELPPRPPHPVYMHLHDREWRQPRGPCERRSVHEERAAKVPVRRK
ncbi:hypothetical protein MN608_00891 [Microdochium nivale]|nr:hypothetical protein MN608_00891 [Microdochium nivale]